MGLESSPGAGSSGPLRLVSALGAFRCPGRAGCQSGPGCALADWRRRARRTVQSEPGTLGASGRRRLPPLRAAATGTRAWAAWVKA